MAGTYYPTTCNPVDQHSCDPCETQELGRVRSVAFISASYYDTLAADPTDPTLWSDGINSGDILVIPETHGELPLPSPKMQSGFGNTVEQLIAYDFSAKYYDPNYASNCDWYNTLKRNRNFYWAYRTSSKIHISTNTVTIIPGAAVPDDLTGLVNWEVTVKWQAADLPCPYTTPDGIFDECYEPA